MTITILHKIHPETLKFIHEEFLDKLKDLTLNIETIMGTQQDILTEIAAIKTDVSNSATAATAISTQIANLQAQIAAEGGLDPVAIKSALDDLKTNADSLASNLGNIANPPAPAPAPAPATPATPAG